MSESLHHTGKGNTSSVQGEGRQLRVSDLPLYIEELTRMNDELKEARRAALNLMEDAIQSREALRRSEEMYRTELEKQVQQRTAELNESRERYAFLVAKKAEEKHRLLFENMNEGLALCEIVRDSNEKSVDFRYIDVNPAFERQNGLRKENVIGRLNSEIQLRDDTAAQYDKAVRTGQLLQFDQYVAKVGRWFAIRIIPLAGEQFAALFADITEKKQAEQELHESEMRKTVLLRLSDALHPLSQTSEIRLAAARVVADALGADRVSYVDIDAGGKTLLFHDSYVWGDLTPMEGHYLIKDFGSLFAGQFLKEKVIAVADADSITKQWFKSLKTRALAIVPILTTEEGLFSICIEKEDPWQWTSSSLNLMKAAAERIRAASAKAAIEEALHTSEERLRVTMDSAVDYAIITMDTERRVQRWSSGAAKTFGYSEEEMIGKSADTIFTPEDRDDGAPQEEIDRARMEGRSTDERWHLRKDGSRLFLSGVVAPIFQGTLTGYVKVARDMTNQKLVEQKKDEFIGVASHELKTPATTIKGYAQLLHQQCIEDNYAIGMDLSARLGSQVNRLINLVSALLDTTRIMQKQLILKPEKFDLCKLVLERVEEIQHLSPDHRIRVTVAENCIVNADKDRISQVLVNLLSNAVKYSPDSKDIIVNCVVNDGLAEVSVKDHGVGISKDVQVKIFDRFFREYHLTVNMQGGLGLGLYIAANIVYQHKGSIRVESEPGKGSIFYFTLPC